MNPGLVSSSFFGFVNLTFLRIFCRLSRIEITKKKNLELRERKLMDLATTRIADTWTPDEEASAIRKIAKIAFVYDSCKVPLLVSCIALKCEILMNISFPFLS